MVCGDVYQTTGLLIFGGLDGVVQVEYLVLFPPVLGVLELLEGFLGDKTTGTQEAPMILSAPHAATFRGGPAYSIVSSSWPPSIMPRPG